MGLAAWIHHARLNARDAIELILVPGMAAWLPWPVCFRLFRWLAVNVPWLYRASCEAALQQAQARGWVPEGQRQHWAAQRRLVTLVDHADLYLSATRSDRWMQHHLDVRGAWPAAGQAGILCTFHWGAGMWGLRHMHGKGLRASALVAALGGAPFAGRPVLHWYARRRTAMVARVLGRPALDVSGSLRPALRALRERAQVLAAIDVPADQVAGCLPVNFAGEAALVPKALLRLAADHQIPVTVYLTGMDMATGRRHLAVHSLGVHTDAQALAGAVFGFLDKAIHSQSTAWHFWSEAPRFFRGHE